MNDESPTSTTPMKARLDYASASPQALKAMYALEVATRRLGLEPGLLELVKLRASQINGCAYCVDLHTRDARAAGESDERMHLVSVWHEAPVFTARERAALAWTEALTRIADTHVPDDVYEEAKAQFSDAELVNLTLAVVTINGWNRFAVSFRAVPAGKTTAELAATARGIEARGDARDR
jgi:AhpD family alkylhydroperoxidase